MMQKMRTFYLTGSEIFDGFSGPFYYENYNSQDGEDKKRANHFGLVFIL